MTDLAALIVFAKVVETNSFSEAARRLKMPLSTVSRRIADLEAELGVRLLDRTTRKLRVTDIGSELLEYARRTAELQEAVLGVASDHQSALSGLLRIAAPPSISASLIAPMTCAFQAQHPHVRVQVLITERDVDLIAEGIDLVFHVGDLKDSGLVAKRILTYRHQVLASPEYLSEAKPLRSPEDLLQHRLFAFSRFKPDFRWRFTHADNGTQQSLRFQPYVSMNDYAGLAYALLQHAGIGELPPIVQPDLVRDGRLVEVIPGWHLRLFNLSLVHLGDRHTPRVVRAFKDFAALAARSLFPSLPT